MFIKMLSMPIAACIFDQDGLLFDTESVYAVAWVEVSNRHNYGFTDAMTRKISGYGRAEIGEQVLKYISIPDVESYVDEVMVRARELLLSAPPKLKPGVREILKWCREKGIKCAVASSAPRDCVEFNLRTTELRQYFDAVVTGEDVKNGKPAPDIFLKAAEELKVSPEYCIVFEDAFSGIRAAAAAGMQAVLVPDRRAAEEEIKKLCTVCSSLVEAQVLLDKIG